MPEVLARLGRGEDVDASEYTFRTSTEIETAGPDLNWLNKGVLISVKAAASYPILLRSYEPAADHDERLRRVFAGLSLPPAHE